MKETNIELCLNVQVDIAEGLAAVFGKDKISVEIEQSDKGNESILIDGWLCLYPSEEKNKWDFSTLKFIPQTYWEPEDVDIKSLTMDKIKELVTIGKQNKFKKRSFINEINDFIQEYQRWQTKMFNTKPSY